MAGKKGIHKRDSQSHNPDKEVKNVRNLIVYAHPNPESFNNGILETVVRASIASRVAAGRVTKTAPGSRTTSTPVGVALVMP